VRNQFCRVGQLRQQLRGNERPNLNLALTGGVGGVDPGEFLRSWQDGLNALQAVTQADFADDHVLLGGLGHKSSFALALWERACPRLHLAERVSRPGPLPQKLRQHPISKNFRFHLSSQIDIW
jgi:hypothetical protein